MLCLEKQFGVRCVQKRLDSWYQDKLVRLPAVSADLYSRGMEKESPFLRLNGMNKRLQNLVGALLVNNGIENTKINPIANQNALRRG